MREVRSARRTLTLAVFQKWILDYFLMYVVDAPTLGLGRSASIPPKKGPGPT
jgi:hypothetical protein